MMARFGKKKGNNDVDPLTVVPFEPNLEIDTVEEK